MYQVFVSAKKPSVFLAFSHGELFRVCLSVHLSVGPSVRYAFSFSQILTWFGAPPGQYWLLLQTCNAIGFLPHTSFSETAHSLRRFAWSFVQPRRCSKGLSFGRSRLLEERARSISGHHLVRFQETSPSGQDRLFQLQIDALYGQPIAGEFLPRGIQRLCQLEDSSRGGRCGFRERRRIPRMAGVIGGRKTVFLLRNDCRQS